MKKELTINWYHYINFDGNHVVELEIINQITGAIEWKLYTGKNRKDVTAKAKRIETIEVNRFNRIYK